MSTLSKPIPKPTLETKPYWDACRKHELRIQRCKRCGEYRHYPQPMCPHCYSFEVDWVKVSGKGKVYSWVVCHHAFHPAFAEEVPYAVVTIELEEGVRLISRMVDTKPEELAIDMPVEVVFEDVNEEVTLPVFKRL